MSEAGLAPTSAATNPSGTSASASRKAADDPTADRRRFNAAVFAGAGVWGAISLIGIVAFVGSASEFALALVAVYAASAVGGLLGFLFGVPMPPRQVGGDHQEPDVLLANSNLGQVSDWLTKIIVGVGLVQFEEIAASVRRVGRTVGVALGDLPGQPNTGYVFALALVIGAALITFMLMYMWTAVRYVDVYGARGLRSARHNRSTEAS